MAKSGTHAMWRLLLHIPVPWVFILVYLIGVLLHMIYPIHWIEEEHTFVMELAGGILFILAGILAGWCLWIFKKAHTTTIPGQRSKKLIIGGPYRFSRNPMYLSLTLAYLGEGLLLVQAWPIFLLPFVVMYVHFIVIPLEESILTADFQDDYANYCQKIRRWL